MNTKCGHTCSLEKLFQESPPSSPLPLNIYLIGTVLDTENMEKAILTFLYYDSNVIVEISLMQLYSAIYWSKKLAIFECSSWESGRKGAIESFCHQQGVYGGMLQQPGARVVEESGEVCTCQRSRVMFLSCLR